MGARKMQCAQTGASFANACTKGIPPGQAHSDVPRSRKAGRSEGRLSRNKGEARAHPAAANERANLLCHANSIMMIIQHILSRVTLAPRSGDFVKRMAAERLGKKRNSFANKDSHCRERNY